MKKKANFTLDQETIERLDKFSKESMIAKSKVVNAAINKWIDDKENKQIAFRITDTKKDPSQLND